jgi:hypothetical protein
MTLPAMRSRVPNFRERMLLPWELDYTVSPHRSKTLSARFVAFCPL